MIIIIHVWNKNVHKKKCADKMCILTGWASALLGFSLRMLQLTGIHQLYVPSHISRYVWSVVKKDQFTILLPVKFQPVSYTRYLTS